MIIAARSTNNLNESKTMTTAQKSKFDRAAQDALARLLWYVIKTQKKEA